MLPPPLKCIPSRSDVVTLSTQQYQQGGRIKIYINVDAGARADRTRGATTRTLSVYCCNTLEAQPRMPRGVPGAMPPGKIYHRRVQHTDFTTRKKEQGGLIHSGLVAGKKAQAQKKMMTTVMLSVLEGRERAPT